MRGGIGAVAQQFRKRLEEWRGGVASDLTPWTESLKVPFLITVSRRDTGSLCVCKSSPNPKTLAPVHHRARSLEMPVNPWMWEDDWNVGDIQSRLFDHKPVLQGEIRYFVREFEEKRGLREKRLLDNVNSMISEVHGRGVPELQDSMQSSTSAILMRLEAANHMTQRILQRDSVKEQSDSPPASREKYQSEWEEFMKEQTRRKEEVDEEHAKAVTRLSAHYGELERDLAKFTTF
ncbi:BL1S5 protein, partial [Polypterus senegalus]